jgi:hypothetical protein
MSLRAVVLGGCALAGTVRIAIGVAGTDGPLRRKLQRVGF